MEEARPMNLVQAVKHRVVDWFREMRPGVFVALLTLLALLVGTLILTSTVANAPPMLVGPDPSALTLDGTKPGEAADATTP